MKPFDLIGFDADDTLWHNENLYSMGIERFKQLLAGYVTGQEAEERLDATEMRNLKYYGYGITSFTLSLIETAIEASGRRIPAGELLKLLDLSHEMIGAEVRLFERVEETLETLADSYPLLMITKGDLLHQQSKLERSGLQRLFSSIEVVSNKTRESYAAILSRHRVEPGRFLMVGNSLRSDIQPVVELGGWAVYIPYELTWQHEVVDDAGLPAERFFELEHIGLLPKLVERLAAR